MSVSVERIGKFLRAEQSEVEFNGKPVYEILDNRGGLLAQVFWHKDWTQWVSRHAPNTIWSAGCDRDMAKFKDNLKAVHP